MSVRIGKIELSGVQDLHTEEARTLVEQRVPEQQGSVFQDLGREPVTILIDGLLFGDESLSALETLRQAHAKAEPQSFAADLVVGTDLTDVIIEDFKVRQVAGYKDRYRFSLRLREHIEAPEASDAAMADVNAQVSADGAAWGDASLAAAGVLQDPASLPAALAANPALLDNLDMDALGDAVAGNLDKLDTGQLNGMLDTLAAADPTKAGGLIDALGRAGALGGMLAKYAQEGADFLKQLDPSKLSSLMKAFSGGLDFLKQLKAVADSATRLAGAIRDLKLPPELDRIIKGGPK
ncbi:MAG: DNA circularization N-terminal domain-containing protein [Zoogloea sp.]|nr:DNA circularization N-terminal domain-containing protein [Zoogloea sp.]